MAEPIIKIPIGDWMDEYIQAEKDVSSKDKLIERIREGLTTPQVARMAIIARERGEADDDVLPANKLMLAAGAMHEVSALVVRQRRKIVTKSGKTIYVREFVGRVPEEEDEGEETEPDAQQMEMDVEGIELLDGLPTDDKPGMVSVFDPIAVQRAQRYLFERVPGYVYGRLAILAANNADVRGVAGELIKLIWQIVERLE